MSSENKYSYLWPEQSDTGRYSLIDENGNDVYGDLDGPSPGLMKKAVEADQCVRLDNETGRFYRKDKKFYFNKTQSVPLNEQEQSVEEQRDHDEIVTFIQKDAIDLKPRELFMDDLTWKYLVRNIVRSKNTMMCGPTGSGKTQTVKWVAEALNRPLFKFNLGATQDPRGALIGNTHFASEEGTFFNQSPFVKAIQTPNAVILLDELSRANPEAANILMTVLDDGQRYLRLDEAEDSPVVKVNPTVTFVATANIGVEYSATRVMDRALKDRFVPITMEYLSEDDEFSLLKLLFPNVSDHNRRMVAKAVTKVREDVRSEDGQLTHNLSTRHSIDMASLLNDGFTIHDALELIVWPQYDTDGGMDSDQSYAKKLIQAIITEEPEEVENVDTENNDSSEIPDF